MSSIKSDSGQAPVKNNIAKSYGKIILTLKNQLLPEEKLETTPSRLDGLDSETETELRIYGCELIQTAGILLKLPQVAMATGQVLLQRFYYSKSLVRHPVEPTAMACVCLASKIEEAPRRARDVINVFNHIRQITSNKPITPILLDQNYIQLKNHVIKAERRVLKELGFCVHIKHPHKIIVMYLQVLGYEKHHQLMQYSWNYMNDSLRTDVFVRYQPETVACACIYLTARKLKLPLPKNPVWFSLFGVTEEEIRDVAIRILRIYSRPKINVDLVEKKIEDLVKKYNEAKSRARGTSGIDTPNNNSPGSPGRQKSGAHNAWGGFISRSGTHAAASNEKRSRSKSGSHSPVPNKHHKRSKKHRSRSRTPTRNHKRAHKHRGSYSKSRSNSPTHKTSKKTSTNGSTLFTASGMLRYISAVSGRPSYKSKRDKHKSRSNSLEKETKNDKYIDRYDKYYDKYDKYKEDRHIEKDRYDDRKDRYDEKKDKYEKKYERDRGEYREEKYKEDRYKEDRYSNRDDKEKYKKSKHRDEEKVRDRSKDHRK